MSRTYHHRPRWVKLNDPKFPTKERHQHFQIKREKTGKFVEVTRHKWIGAPKYTEPYTVMVPEYAQWVEHVPCTIDLPEVSWMNERQRVKSDNREKLCDKQELIWSCPCCSNKGKKKEYNRATRSRINQQLHCAIRDYGWTTDLDEWCAVDVSEAHHAYNEWWD